MTNYTIYPAHRFTKGTCIICFDENSYSWCYLNEKQKQYLSESKYLNGAKAIDINTYNGSIYSLTREKFLEWVKSGLPEPSVGLQSESRSSEICPQCGKPLVLRTARKGQNTGKQFWGCTGYPECTYTRDY